MKNQGKGTLCLFAVLLLGLGLLCCRGAENRNRPTDSEADAFAQLAALEGCLETHLALHGGPPAKWVDLAGFYDSEHRLEPGAPRIDSRKWQYSVQLEKDCYRDPTDPDSPGAGWRMDAWPSPGEVGWPPPNRPWRTPEGRWIAQARGLTVRLQREDYPNVRMVKWLPLAEQLAMAQNSDSRDSIRLLNAWHDNVPGNADSASFVPAILPALETYIESPESGTRFAAVRCAAKVLEQSLAFDPKAESPYIQRLMAALRPCVRDCESTRCLVALHALRLLPLEVWRREAQSWLDDPDPRLRRALVIAYEHQWSYNFTPSMRPDGLPTYPNPKVFDRFRDDPDRQVRLELLRLVGTHTSLFAGSSESAYFGKDSILRFVLEILTGQDDERKIALLGGMKDSEYHYLESAGTHGNKERTAELQKAMDDLNADSNLVLRRESLRVRLWGDWHPTSFSLVQPLLNSDDPKNLRVAAKALLPLLTRSKADIPKEVAKEAFLKRARQIEDPLIVPFLALDAEPEWQRNHYESLLTPEEEVPLLDRWAKSSDPLVRRLVIQRVYALLGKPDKLAEAALRALEERREALLNDRDPGVRLHAALVMFYYPKKDDELKAWIAAQPDPLRRDAVLQFFTTERAWLRDELLRVLESGDARSRWDAHQCLLALGDTAAALAYQERQSARFKVQRSYREFRVLIAAVESYNVDYGGGLDALAHLTAPIAYVHYLPRTPFGTPNSQYRYYRPPKTMDWFLQGPGPHNRDAFGKAFSEIEEACKIENYDLRKRRILDLTIPIQYDPTNGALSSGDYLHVWP